MESVWKEVVTAYFSTKSCFHTQHLENKLIPPSEYVACKLWPLKYEAKVLSTHLWMYYLCPSQFKTLWRIFIAEYVSYMPHIFNTTV